MKLFRLLALTLAIGIFSAFPMQVRAQQEVDPDHFDQAPVAQANVHGAKALSNHKAANAAHRNHSNVRVATKRSGRANHHRAHVSA